MRFTRRSHVSLLSIICTLAFASGVARNGQSDARAQTPNAQAASQSNVTPQSNVTQQSNAASQTSSATEQRVFCLTVTDSKGNLISGLRREDLSAFDGKESREIVSFDASDVPASVLFLVDTSSSAFGENTSKLGRRRFAALKDAVSAFIEGSNTADEYFVTAFNRSPQVILDGSTDARTVLDSLDRLASADLKGFTAMYDAVLLSLNKLATRPTQKHVVVLLSDGMDNSSHYTYSEVRGALKQSDVLVYSVGVFVEDESGMHQVGRAILSDLADVSAGTALFPDDEPQIKIALTKIAAELRGQYEVTVATEANAKGDGWHDVRFKLGELRDAQGKRVKAIVRSRRGFYDASAPRHK